MDKQNAIQTFSNQLEIIDDLLDRSSDFVKWKRDTEIAIENIFGCDTRHIQDFKRIGYTVTFGGSSSYNLSTGKATWDEQERELKREEAFNAGLRRAKSILHSFIQEIDDYWLDRTMNSLENSIDAIEKIELICNRFHKVVRQMRSRYENRSTLEINDEYDVQDLFHSLLTLYFDDVRREESNPSHAGSNSRSDFLLKPEQTIIEIKKTRQGLNDKKLGEELTLDIQKYPTHPDCKTLICFVYDPEGKINNPRGLERDLEKITEKIEVKVFIRP